MNRYIQFERDRGDIEYALVSCPQSRDQLEERESKNDAVSIYIQKKKVGNVKEKASEKDRERKNGKRTSVQKIIEVKESIWKREVRKNIHKKTIELCDKTKKRVCAEKSKGIFSIEGKKRESTSIYGGSTAKRVYLAIKVATDFASTLCSRERWQKENSTGLLPY